MAENKFLKHAFKKEILDMWDAGKTSKDVFDFLNSKGKEYYISYNTLAKYHKRYKSAKLKPKGIDEKEERILKKLFSSKEEEYLWETIEHCRNMKNDKMISAKEWQYYDMQMQTAIRLLQEVKGSADKVDLSTIMSKLIEEVKDEQGTAEKETSDKVS